MSTVAEVEAYIDSLNGDPTGFPTPEFGQLWTSLVAPDIFVARDHIRAYLREHLAFDGSGGIDVSTFFWDGPVPK